MRLLLLGPAVRTRGSRQPAEDAAHLGFHRPAPGLGASPPRTEHLEPEPEVRVPLDGRPVPFLEQGRGGRRQRLLAPSRPTSGQDSQSRRKPQPRDCLREGRGVVRGDEPEHHEDVPRLRPPGRGRRVDPPKLRGGPRAPERALQHEAGEIGAQDLGIRPVEEAL